MTNIFLGAIIFAIWSVVLFYGKAIGLSMLLFAVPITYYIIHIIEKNNSDINKKAKILIIPITLLSSTYLIYNNRFFNIINILVIPTIVVLMILGLYKEKFEISFSIIKKILKVGFKPITFIGEACKKAKESFKEKTKIDVDSEKSMKIKKVLKALAITIPVVLIIIWLLSSADQIFGNIFGNILESIADFIRGIEFSTVIEEIILIIIAFFYFLGFFYYITSKYQTISEKENNTKKDSFTIKMVLGALNAIYLIFCFIQIKSLFMRVVNINYAEYARQGFFQLMLVSIINLFTVLIAKKREKQEEQKNKYIKIMCLAMVLFTFIILISASYRMYLYETAYGYTLLRLLVYCVLFTEAVLLIPTILYIIDKNIDLPKAYFAIVITIYICMNFANFDNLIAKRNIDRYIEKGKIDLYYLQLGTGTDAVNQMMRILKTDENEEGVKRKTELYLKSMYNHLEAEDLDIREFNISKQIAKRKIKEKNIQIEDYETMLNTEYINNIVPDNNTDYREENEVIEEEFYGIVKKKTGNELELSYTTDIYEKSIKYIHLKESDKDKVNIGDWVKGSGKVIGKKYNAQIISTNTLEIIPRDEYKNRIERNILGMNKLSTAIESWYEEEYGGTGYVYCTIYAKDNSGIPIGFVRVDYDKNTKMYLGNAENPVNDNYYIVEHELVDITFKEKVQDINKIYAKTMEFIAD